MILSSMLIAGLGDIHGNLHALKAAHAEALKRGAERVLHLGDLGGYAPFVNEVAAFLEANRIEGVRGNYDDNVAKDAPHCGCKYEDPVRAALAERSFAWTKLHATERTRRFMAALPEVITFADSGWRAAVFHASPHKNNLYWHEDRPARFYIEMAARIEADVYIYGHTHVPYRKDLGGKVFINAGSVGKPKDGDPRACLAMVEFAPGRVSHEFVRVSYDVTAAAEAIRASGLPEEFAGMLLRGE